MAVERVPLKYEGEVIRYADVDLDLSNEEGMTILAYITEGSTFLADNPEVSIAEWGASVFFDDAEHKVVDVTYIPVN
jgi:hypothetical protein